LGQQGNLEEEQHQQSTVNLEINILGEQQQQHHRTVELESEDQDWGETWWEEIVRHPREAEESARNGRQCTDVEQHSRDERRAGRWRNRPQTARTRANIKSFRQGAGNFRATLRPTEEQIRAATRKGVTDVDSRVTENEGFRESAERVHAVRTTEEELVQELILQWQKGAHGYIPETKEDDILRLGCENVNSLSLYNPKGSKMRKLINIHNKYQTDGACIVEHGINFRMSSDRNRPSDIFSGIRGSRVSAAHNVHEAHGR